MAASHVNLDALIPREDFESTAGSAGGRLRETISLSDLEETGFFQRSLRKPDFQRETTHWTPAAVCDLVWAYLEGHLIPAVILWQSGDKVFVIDGAHRISALIAWIRDDYGDGTASNARFGSGLTDEQKRVAKRTRDQVRKKIGSYAEFKGLIDQEISDPQKAKWVSRIGTGSVEIQWVTATNSKAAEDSFFKINQAAQPIDPTERRILQTRRSPNSIAARCIARGGKGHKYWSSFDRETQEEIESIGEELNSILYDPPHSGPVTTTDVPIAGQGYSALPFVYELVSVCNKIPLPTSSSAKKLPEPLPEDKDGQETLAFLKSVKSRLRLISTNYSGSLGLHPLVYCYSSTGNFQPNAFLATVSFAELVKERRKKEEFTKYRERFEKYLLRNRTFVSLTMSRLGASGRSQPRIIDLYWSILSEMLDGAADDEILPRLTIRKEFAHLKQLEVPPPGAEFEGGKKSASSASKSSAFIRNAMETPLKCGICGAAVHCNSITFDHIVRVRDGGGNRGEDMQPTHPFCNSGIKS
ncbi:HNH endonuclease signature motif containing protein [Cribrihabitans marinus]|nr:HNH endonuclease signature motif containing protein [Cribrihabitans marinus]